MAQLGQEEEELDVASSPAAARRWPLPAPGPWRDALLRRMLACADLGAAAAAGLSLWLGLEREPTGLAWSLLALPAWVVVAKLLGLYERDQRSLRHLTVDEAPWLLLWALAGAGGLALLLVAAGVGISTGEAAWLVLVAACSSLLLRALARRLWRLVTPPERTAIVGSGSLAAAARRKVELYPEMHLEVVAEYEDGWAGEEGDWTDRLRSLDRVIVASSSPDEEALRPLVASARSLGVKVSIVPPFRGVFATAAQLNRIGDLPVLEYSTWHLSRSTLALKRLLDVTVSAVALPLLAPLFLLIAAAVKLDSPGPALFCQWRAGLHGRPFRMYKFRTMAADAEERLAEVVPLDRLAEPVYKLRHDPRVTRVGRVLRRWSLDELPQLVNVLRGEMSLVGPRPEAVELVRRYRPEHRIRLAVRPGLTGPMQVYGRGELTFEERLEVERHYIDTLSLPGDLRILALTVGAVVRGQGAW